MHGNPEPPEASKHKLDIMAFIFVLLGKFNPWPINCQNQVFAETGK
jgi:hypothetical protein